MLRLPASGLPYLRHDRAAELTTEPGGADRGPASSRSRRTATPDPDRRDRLCGAPGLVDCHTHLPFAGWREREYAPKVAGATYEQIARAGGGIRSSARVVRRARATSRCSRRRGAAAGEMLAHGTTTFECKSGYGLSIERRRPAR